MQDFDIQETQLIKYLGNSHTVVIPNTVRYILRDAFADCKHLKSIVIPELYISKLVLLVAVTLLKRLQWKDMGHIHLKIVMQ